MASKEGVDSQIFLQRESAEDALDFWLDVQQHENMCKAYLKVSLRLKSAMRELMAGLAQIRSKRH